MQYKYSIGPLINAVNNPIDMRLVSIQQVSKFLVFGDDDSTVRIFVQIQDKRFEPVKPYCGLG
jgi:hypothetical protein